MEDTDLPRRVARAMSAFIDSAQYRLSEGLAEIRIRVEHGKTQEEFKETKSKLAEWRKEYDTAAVEFDVRWEYVLNHCEEREIKKLLRQQKEFIQWGNTALASGIAEISTRLDFKNRDLSEQIEEAQKTLTIPHYATGRKMAAAHYGMIAKDVIDRWKAGGFTVHINGEPANEHQIRQALKDY